MRKHAEPGSVEDVVHLTGVDDGCYAQTSFKFNGEDCTVRTVQPSKNFADAVTALNTMLVKKYGSESEQQSVVPTSDSMYVGSEASETVVQSTIRQ